MSEKKVIDETFSIASKRGNGLLRREVWVDKRGRVTRYNLAYINHALYRKDNGRVIGYDNAHGEHHRHYFGQVEAVQFISFEEIESRFQTEWNNAVKGRRK